MNLGGGGHDFYIIILTSLCRLFFNFSLFVFGYFCTRHENKVTPYIIFLFLIALPVLFILGEPLGSLQMHPPWQQNCNERVAWSASPPCCQQYSYLGNTVDKTNSHCQIIPAFVTALSYYPTRWVHVQWGGGFSCLICLH